MKRVSKETPLTGELAEKVTSAALAKIPEDTVDLVETNDDGVYEVYMAAIDG